LPGYRRMAWKVRRPDRTRPAWAARVSPPQAYAQSRTRDLERPYGHAEQRSNLVSASPLCHQLLNLIDSFWGKFPASPGGGAAIRHCYGSANLARQTQSNGQPSRWFLCRKSDVGAQKARRSGPKLASYAGLARAERASPPTQRQPAQSVAQRRGDARTKKPRQGRGRRQASGRGYALPDNSKRAPIDDD
jgi:hypothetical protein